MPGEVIGAAEAHSIWSLRERDGSGVPSRSDLMERYSRLRLFVTRWKHLLTIYHCLRGNGT